MSSCSSPIFPPISKRGISTGRRFVSALIVPNLTHLETYAREHKLAFRDHAELIAKPEIEALFREHVERATAQLAPHEKIRQFILLPTEFTLHSGELSVTQKIKRRVVEERYRDLVEKMYSKDSALPPRRAAASSAPDGAPSN